MLRQTPKQTEMGWRDIRQAEPCLNGLVLRALSPGCPFNSSPHKSEVNQPVFIAEAVALRAVW